MLLQRSLKCPHCLEPNPAFGPQRCQSCGLNMFSNQIQALREKRIRPLAEQLEKQLLNLKGGKDPASAAAYAYQLLDALEPYEKVEELSFLPELLQEARQQLEPFPRKKQRDRSLQLNIFILVLLALFPLSFLMIGGEPLVVGLLSLPVVGWAYLGIYAYVRKRNA
jgi:hypothetical protein